MTTEHDLAHGRTAPRAPSPPDDDLLPGRGSRSSQLAAPSHPIAGGLLLRKARDANGVADDAEQAVGAIRALGERVERNGVSAVIFPEGTRARRGELGGFKPRGSLALLAAAPTTEIVPVAIDESWRLMRHNFLPIPFGVRVRVHVGDPIRRRPGEDHAELLERVRDEIAAALATMRGETVTPPRIAAVAR